ncbi:MAG: glycosyltransferase [Victivallales bacterium]|jgi:glycosyltransferase involved in cell wall biosynthesis|nr:glycosyltransferase [Victivallales bacterium]
MRILHYYLGRHRQGGLNRYAKDLSTAQAKSGHDVFTLYPGGGILPRHQVRILPKKTVEQVEYHELQGGVPVPLLEGICDPAIIIDHSKHLSAFELKRFCDHVRADVLHIHTLMGFPPELLDELKKRGTRVVFTTHDYFGLCPKVNFIDSEGNLCSAPDNKKCSLCNSNAPNAGFLALRNWSLLFRVSLKTGNLAKNCISHSYARPCAHLVNFMLAGCLQNRASKLRICNFVTQGEFLEIPFKLKSLLTPLLRHRNRNQSRQKSIAVVTKDYLSLQDYYKTLLQKCDAIHFNSEVAEKVYRKFLPDLPGEVIPITHAGIVDRRKPRTVDARKVRLGFIGSAAPYKGLPILLQSFEQLRNEGVTNAILNIYGCVLRSNSDSIRFCGSFAPDDSEKAFAQIDLLIVPSVWSETFGFVVPEALSRGIPVLCADTVGAKILLDGDMVYHGECGLYTALRELLSSVQHLEEKSKNICASLDFTPLSKHVKTMDLFYRK